MPRALRTGEAVHAFEHLGSIGHQAESAAASGATVIYASGVGALGYGGLPPAGDFERQKREEAAYAREAKRRGIRVVLGYVCATSIVGLETFDRHWTPELRARLRTPPADWRQQGRDGEPLASWYGGAYQPACMSNPDWRTYQRFIVRQQIETGHDGIFFDNPTVHPQGCYCPHCMAGFAAFLQREGVAAGDRSVEALRSLANARRPDFARFRCTIARDFLADMRSYARSARRGALVTANNSLNSPGALYAQCRSFAYNIQEMARAEDFVVVEDMGSQPRVLPNGTTVEYGPTYKLVHAIIHDKPLVAVTIADGDYHTPPNLVRLAMAEAAANDASYMVWTAWPEEQRARMAAATRAQADLLRRNTGLLQGSRARREAVLFLPFRRWVESESCAASGLAAALARANVQFAVAGDEGFSLARLRPARVLVVESRAVLAPAERQVVGAFERAGGLLVAADEGASWLARVREAAGAPAVEIGGPPSVRAYVRDQRGRAVVHLLNLNVRRVSSFEDVVTPAADLKLRVRVPFRHVRTVRALTADRGASEGRLAFSTSPEGRTTLVEVRVPRLDVATILVIGP